eukprot:jgi/Mesen1/9554/ME000640S08897
MSGATLASGIRLVPGSSPSESHREEEDFTIGGLMGSVSFMQAQVVAYILVISVSGVIPGSDMAFVLFVTFYAVILSSIVFPTRIRTLVEPVFHENLMSRIWVMIGIAVGLFLPLAYALRGFIKGDKVAVEAALPHIFLLSCQILTENFISELPAVSHPVRAYVPIIYSFRRLWSLGAWARREYRSKVAPVSGAVVRSVWPPFGCVLAAINLVFWTLNLFGFLLPFFLPRAIRKYYEPHRTSVKRQSGSTSSSPRASYASTRRASVH